MNYATGAVPVTRTAQDNLRIYMFAKKHGMTIAEVELALRAADD